jgi:gamma-tubulin complex component 2
VRSFYDRIAAAYTYANRTLLTLLLNDQQLLSRLKSIKHHFFIDQGDAFTHFLDSAHHELSKKSKNVSMTKLQSLLDLAIRNSSSSSSTDPFKEDVKVALMSTTLTEFLMRIANVSGAIGALDTTDGLDAQSKDEEKVVLTGIDAFTLDYHVAFPLSLIISRRTILRYQMIFRHLLHLKHLEQVLTSVWVEQTKSPTWRTRTRYGELERWKFRVVSLRAKMFGFVKEMYGFAVSEVLEPNWRALLVKMAHAETVDGLLRDHTEFLDTCLKECMLTNAKLLKVRLLSVPAVLTPAQLHNKLLHIVTLFTTYSSFITKSVATAQSELDGNGGDWSAINFEKAETAIKRFESNYNHHAKVHADVVSFGAFFAYVEWCLHSASRKLRLGCSITSGRPAAGIELKGSDGRWNGVALCNACRKQL